MEIDKLFNPETVRALEEAQADYVSKDVDEYALIKGLQEKYNLEKVYRFDIGKHTDGFSDLIRGVLEESDLAGMCSQNLIEYPDNHYQLLRHRLAEYYGLNRSWFVISAGLESMIDHISRVFLRRGDKFLIPIPNFSPFESFSRRTGAEPVFVALKEEDRFRWTERTVDELIEALGRSRPNLVWISNPVNPTGQDLPLDWIAAVVRAAWERGVAVVVDEAYGEYTDRDDRIISAAELAADRPNLMVLRTFSKIHALPSLRVGYLMSSSPRILEAVDLYRPMFPFSWFSLFVAQIALVDEEHPQRARRQTARRRDKLLADLAALPAYDHLLSATNTVMVRHPGLSAEGLWSALAARGILAANLASINGLIGREFLRLTVRAEPDNDYLVAVLRDVAGGVGA